MNVPVAERFNLVRWSPVGHGGLIESLFLKFHLPELRAAFWARYTLRRPQEGRGEPVGCLWAVFSEEGGTTIAGCDAYPAREVAVGRDRFYVRIGPGEMTMGRATGQVTTSGRSIAWSLDFETGSPCLIHFPSEALYRGPFPRNKIASPHFRTRFRGTLCIGDRMVTVSDAVGMQGHNWGPTVSPSWLWAHATGFDGESDAVFEAVSSRLMVGPFRSPPLTILALRARGRQVLFNRPDLWVRNRCDLRGLRWEVSGSSGGVQVAAEVTARPQDTVGLDYLSPDGQRVRCVNSNLASARVVVTGFPGGHFELTTSVAATLEIGGLDAPRDIPVLVTG